MSNWLQPKKNCEKWINVDMVTNITFSSKDKRIWFHYACEDFDVFDFSSDEDFKEARAYVLSGIEIHETP